MELAGWLAIVCYLMAFALSGFFFVVWFKRQNATAEELQTNKFLLKTKSVPSFSYVYSVWVPMVFIAWGGLLQYIAIWR